MLSCILFTGFIIGLCAMMAPVLDLLGWAVEKLVEILKLVACVCALCIRYLRIYARRYRRRSEARSA